MLVAALPIPILVLLNLWLGLHLFRGGGDESGLGALLRAFDVDSENLVPTTYNAMLLAGAAVLMVVVAARTRARWVAMYWLALAAVFVYLTTDEALAIHERSSEPIRQALGVGGFLYFAWVIPATGLLVLFVVAFIPFLRTLDRRLRVRLLVAGAIYVGGALIFEMISAYFFDSYGPGPGRHIASMIEESLEMVGLLVLLAALVGHLRWPTGRQDRVEDC